MIRHGALLLTVALLAGCSTLYGNSSNPGMAYVGDLAEIRTAHEGDIVAYAKSKDGEDTFVYVFKGFDSKGAIHIVKMRRDMQNSEQQSGGILSWFTGEEQNSSELVFMPEQTMLVSPGVHIVFIVARPGELQYRIIMTGA